MAFSVDDAKSDISFASMLSEGDRNLPTAGQAAGLTVMNFLPVSTRWVKRFSLGSIDTCWPQSPPLWFHPEM